ncbi:Uu.00g146850.m01.CDS01 [Anthostomella pinea]|uniref:Uu.00g146850.m01.CDS01 n=1 Tax=Anthostomella pinea TaxID=933095 RepID=A0AAI8VS52_9PEZI|nr:Uu.00g146850.m01.CDS01 [Anthostomella pinea]
MSWELTASLRAGFALLTSNIITWSQFVVYACWWAHYKKHPERHRDFGVELANVPSLLGFCAQIPPIIRATEESGLSFYPNLARAAAERLARNSDHIPDFDFEKEVLEDFESQDMTITGYLTPGGLSGTRNACFSAADLADSEDLKPPSPGWNQARSVSKVTESLGSVETIYRPRPQIQNPTQELTFTQLLSRKEVMAKSYRIINRYPADVKMDKLRRVRAGDGVDIVVPGLATKIDHSQDAALANRPDATINSVVDAKRAHEQELAKKRLRVSQDGRPDGSKKRKTDDLSPSDMSEMNAEKLQALRLIVEAAEAELHELEDRDGNSEKAKALDSRIQAVLADLRKVEGTKLTSERADHLRTRAEAVIFDIHVVQEVEVARKEWQQEALAGRHPQLQAHLKRQVEAELRPQVEAELRPQVEEQARARITSFLPRLWARDDEPQV